MNPGDWNDPNARALTVALATPATQHAPTTRS
jgi:hypothetical protein